MNTLNKYEIWTKEKYINYMVNIGTDAKCINECWEDIRKGYDFVITIYKDDLHECMIYSVPYFNKFVIK